MFTYLEEKLKQVKRPLNQINFPTKFVGIKKRTSWQSSVYLVQALSDTYKTLKFNF